MDILGSIGMGAITGLVGPIITGLTNYKMKKMDNNHKILMIKAETDAMKAETEASIQVERIKTEGLVEVAEAESFTESIKTGQKDFFKEKYMTDLFSRKWTAPFGIIISFLFGLIDFLRGAVRPVLTFYMIGASTWITILAYELVNKSGNPLTSDQAYVLFDKVIMTILYMTVSISTWWFGDRATKKYLNEYISK